MTGKFALVIGNTEYADPGLAQLTAPGRDAEDFARVLRVDEFCGFDDVRVLLNKPSSAIIEAIDEFFDEKKPDDLLVLYFSGHGVRDEIGALYLAVQNTNRFRLRSTAVKSDFIREAMDQSRSKRQVLILDCCNSGAFSQGTKAATGMSIGTATAFEGGYGRVILTASDSTQFAWEGDKVIGETDNSLFTHYLVEGLEGEADLDGDGRITVDELYDYAYEKVKHATPKQTPSKFSSKQQGEIILRQNMPMEEVKSVPLPTPLLDSIENPFSDIRLGAVQQLTKLLKGKNLGMARSAREVLEKIAEEDDSRQVQRAAAQALESVREGETPSRAAEPEIITKEAEHIIHKRAMEAERREKEKAKRFATQTIGAKEEFSNLETENITTPIANRQALITLGWVIAGSIGGAIYNIAEEKIGAGLAGATGGAIGGFVTAIALLLENYRSNWKRIFWFTLAWTVGLSIGWFIGELGTEPIVFAIGYAIGATLSVFFLLSIGHGFSDKKSAMWIVLAWTIGGSLGWTFARKLMIEIWSKDDTTSWIIGTAIGWAIGGYVLGWQLLKTDSQPKLQAGKATEQIVVADQLAVGLKDILLSRWKTLLWISLGWAIGGAIGTIISFNYGSGQLTRFAISGAIGGAIGGFITALAFQTKIRDYNWKSIFLMTLAWAIGGAIGWGMVMLLDINMGSGLGIGFGIGAMISMGVLLMGGLVTFDWKRLTWIVLAWTIGGEIGMSIFSGLNYRFDVFYTTSLSIGIGIGWGIAGFVTGWLLSNYLSGNKP